MVEAQCCFECMEYSTNYFKLDFPDGTEVYLCFPCVEADLVDKYSEIYG